MDIGDVRSRLRNDGVQSDIVDMVCRVHDYVKSREASFPWAIKNDVFGRFTMGESDHYDKLMYALDVLQTGGLVEKRQDGRYAPALPSNQNVKA